jgi:hypothetical protein
MKRTFASFCALSIFALAACSSSSSSTNTPPAGGAGGIPYAGAAGGNAGGAGGNPGPTYTRVDVTDNVTVATTWTANNVYVIPDGATVYVYVGLNLQPGTVVKLGADSQLSVLAGGQLNAVGTALNPIVFTSLKDDAVGGDTNGDGALSSPGMQDWDDVVVTGNQSSFSYCQFRYGNMGLQLDANNLTVANDTFYMNSIGLDASQPSLTGVSITGNTFYGNIHAVRADSNYAVDSTNLFHYAQGTQSWGNTFQAIELSGNIEFTTTWSNTEVAYTFNAPSATTYVYAALTLASGVVVKFAQGDSLTELVPGIVNGKDTAFFTSLSDDLLLGDSNGDGSATQPGLDDWDGISIVPVIGSTYYYDGPNVFWAAN